MILKPLKNLYYKFRYDLPIWIDSKFSKPYLRIWKHKYFCKTELSKREAILRLFELRFGYRFDFDNPVTYNEKIQWLKLYGDIESETRLADKYLVREYVKQCIGEQYLTRLYGVWDNPDDIDFDSLPDKFVLKANHGSGMNIIVTDKSSLDIPKTRKTLRRWLKDNFAWYFMELQYEHIPPKIIAEEYLENRDGDLYDYKVWCFNGKAYYIMFLSERKQGLKMAFYDLQWNKQNFVYNYPLQEQEIERPDNLDEMIEKAELLSAGFPHVRVDFYRLNDGSLKLGELTFSSYMGLCKWEPKEADSDMGKLLDLSAVKSSEAK